MFVIQLCRVNIEIDNRFAYVEKLCRDYVVKDSEIAPAFRVSVSLDELRNYVSHVGRPMAEDEAESYLVYRKICGQMPAYNAYLLHAAVVAVDGEGYAFSAARGEGKTTHTALWETLFAHKGATVINGDKPLIKLEDDGSVTAWGTPWCGKEGKQVNACVSLKAICFLEKGPVNQMRSVSTADGVARMLASTILPPTSALQDAMAYLVGTTLKKTPAYLLSCRPDKEAAMLAYTTLTKK